LGLALLAVTACGGASDSTSDSASTDKGSKSLSLIGYSTPQVVYDEIIPEFQKTGAGEGVGFKSSFGASGEQSRAVEAGLKADVVAFSLEPDMTSLVKAKLVAPTWKKNKWAGMATRSVVVFATRKGNPKHIRTWNDLVKPGVDVVVPNVQTSGGAKWDVIAAYGAQRKLGKSHAQSVRYLSKLYDQVVSQDKSAREALQTFSAGKGDVLLAYENEAIAGQQAGQDLEYVVPDQTILIQNPIAVTTDAKNKAKAQAFVDFTTTPEAQKIFVSKGYRPVVASANDPSKFPNPPGLFKIDKFGGWSKVNDEFFDPDKGSVAAIEKDAGVSTAK
jgi:sulfate transport system substrate-binding protein